MSSSPIEINYRKLKPIDLDGLAEQYEPSEEDIANEYNPFAVSEIQSFNPLYTDFFVLNESNYNRVGLNHKCYLEGSILKTESTEIKNQNYHVKCSPLLDPIHYLVGKYHNVNNLKVLPTLTNNTECFAKIANKQNASYIDGFFSYLSSQLKHKCNMLNAVDFYGSYLANQKVFKATVTDDLEYLHQSKYFMDRIGKDVSVTCGNNFDDFTGIGSRANKKRLVFEEELNANDLGIDVLEPTEYSTLPEPVEDPESENILCEYVKSEDGDSSSDDDTNSSSSGVSNRSKNNTKVDAGGEDSGDEEYSGDEESLDSNSDESLDKDSEESMGSDESLGSDESMSDSEESLEQDAYAYIQNFPTNLIFLEKCEGTLDQLFMDQEIDDKTGPAYLMQIIMTLIVFQKAFHFTHNDLHTNNIMYIHTDIEFLYYKHNNQFYRVPTYGKIFKIIDFGRAIYRFKDQIYCSDSFAPKGDAYSQYNTEPYFNENRPRIEPNLSFDLCRLGTSIYDFIIPDEDAPRDELQETIYRWCMDDNQKNIMYRRDGEERYPGFKLYKMIARNVHAHTPQEQLKYAIFSQFLMAPLDAAKLDMTEVRKYGLNLDLIEREYV
jgi:hypothetical protein